MMSQWKMRMSHMILQHGNGTITNAYYKLLEVKECEDSGGYISSWNSSSYAILERMRRAGFVFWERSGPKGGKRYFVTEKGDRGVEAVCAVAK